MTTADFTPCGICLTPRGCEDARRCLGVICYADALGIRAPLHLSAAPEYGQRPCSPRARILREAEALICGDREADYGPPGLNFQRIAAMWGAYLGHPVTAAQVCDCMALLKLARLAHQSTHDDSRTDAAGYLALGAEVAAQPQPAPSGAGDTRTPQTPPTGPLRDPEGRA